MQVKRQFVFDPDVVSRVADEQESDSQTVERYLVQSMYEIYTMDKTQQPADHPREYYLGVISGGLNSDSCPEYLYAEFIRYNDPDIRAMVVGSHLCPAMVLAQVVSVVDTGDPVFYRAIANPNLPLDAILAHVPMDILLSTVIKHDLAAERLAHDPDSPPEVLRTIVETYLGSKKGARHVLGVARNRSCPVDLLSVMLDNPVELESIAANIKKAVLHHPNATDDVRARAALK